MCITFFFFNANQNPQDLPFKFIQAFNREESFERSNKELGYWEDDPNILGGRDNKAQGTWLGVNIKTGNIAFLTNLPNRFLASQTQLSEPKSRGELVSNFLRSDFYGSYHLDSNMKKEIVNEAIMNYLKKIIERKDDYRGFNMIVGNLKTLIFKHISNDHIEGSLTDLKEGCHVMTNIPFTKEWKKIQEHFPRFENLVQTKNQEIIKKEEMILDQTKEIMENLRIFPFVKFLKKKDEENKISLIPVTTWGTKSTTILLLDHQNKLRVIEISFNEDLSKKISAQFEVDI